MADTKVKITQKDVEAFSAKLQAWGQGLDVKEKTLLHVLMNSAAAGAPGGDELTEKELEGVAGGILSPSVRSTALLARFLGKGGLAAGGEVKDGGNPTVSGRFGPGQVVKY